MAGDVLMQVIIPLTGYGSRFAAAGYEKLKPFIEIHGRPMIEWVVKMFDPAQDRIIFVARGEHLKNLDYTLPELRRIAPDARIFSIENWQKKGPVHDVLQAQEWIDEKEEVIVSYCDYYMRFDYSAFKRDVCARGCDGCVPCYSGFHPHLLPRHNVYASCKTDEAENLIEIREKFSFEKDKMLSRHSPGLYYFRSGEILKKYSRKLIEANDHIKGEFYCSLVYNYLLKDNLRVWCPVNVRHFCQWGTPEDLEEYLFWINSIMRWRKI